MKKILFLVFFLFAAACNAQYILERGICGRGIKYTPDPLLFRLTVVIPQEGTGVALLTLVEGSCIIDYGDGSVPECLKDGMSLEGPHNDHLYARAGTFTISVTGNLQGITFLNFTESYVSSAIVNGLTSLQTLIGNYNTLTTINLTGLNNLTYVLLDHNNLTEGEMTNVINDIPDWEPFAPDPGGYIEISAQNEGYPVAPTLDQINAMQAKNWDIGPK